MKTLLLVKVECDEKECGLCEGVVSDQGYSCGVFGGDLATDDRLPACLSAQGQAEALLAVVKAARKAQGELIWCSGAPVFAPGGDAHEGWKKGPRKAIDALDAALKAYDAAKGGAK
jgi:hypothetical protein